jgi:hypothetical protein
MWQHKYQPAPVGTTVCPEKPSGGGGFDPFEVIVDVFEAVAELWDLVVATFDYLKGKVVGLLVDISGCGTVPPSAALTSARSGAGAATIAGARASTVMMWPTTSLTRHGVQRVGRSQAGPAVQRRGQRPALLAQRVKDRAAVVTAP